MVDVVTRSSGGGVPVVVLEGSLVSRRDADTVADRVLGSFPVDRPLVVEMSSLRVHDPDHLAWLILRLEAAPGWHRVRLVDDRLMTRRQLREICRRLPILPDVDTALSIARAEEASAGGPPAPVGASVVIDLRDGSATLPEVRAGDDGSEPEGLSTGT